MPLNWSFLAPFHILAILFMTTHIWGYIFISCQTNIRTNVIIVHRQRQFSTVNRDLSTVWRNAVRYCLNKYSQMWAFKTGKYSVCLESACGCKLIQQDLNPIEILIQPLYTLFERCSTQTQSSYCRLPEF